MIDLTGLARGRFVRQGARTDCWSERGKETELQAVVLRKLLRKAAPTVIGRKYGFDELSRLDDKLMIEGFRKRVKLSDYEDIRADVMRMVGGEPDVLWPGRCKRFAQSSGTSGGAAKFIPITDDSLKINHFAGASDVVAFYLRENPASCLFSGKALILGGSFSPDLDASQMGKGVRVGDLSATLIEKINPLVNLMRIPGKNVALMSDWEEKLPRIVDAASRANVTNLSGVPSWFLVLLRRVMAKAGVDNLHDVWPDLEVFFHGGISFAPYREQYKSFTRADKMHFVETYNASEGFFAAQDKLNAMGSDGLPPMLLLVDRGIYYEFMPVGGGEVVGIDGVEPGKVYELIISGCNGLWRYRIGDTVMVRSVDPVRITIAGRTKSFINAFGEEVMEHNADAAIARACAATGSSQANYTAAPVWPENGRRGRHQWLIEWIDAPADMEAFAAALDEALQDVNADYRAKRTGGIFMDDPEVVSARRGLFDDWLSANGNKRLGGQRKVPRLSPTRDIMDSLLKMR